MLDTPGYKRVQHMLGVDGLICKWAASLEILLLRKDAYGGRINFPTTQSAVPFVGKQTVDDSGL
jgi:hypothetical protein